MKTIKATGKYAVSFNCQFGEFSCGSVREYSLDHAGDDIDLLAQEVIDDDPSYPLTFERVNIEGLNVVGVFRTADDDRYVTAVMVPYSSI